MPCGSGSVEDALTRTGQRRVRIREAHIFDIKVSKNGMKEMNVIPGHDGSLST